MASKKGFVFTLLVLVIIAYMIIEFNVYMRAYQIRQESEPSRMRALIIGELGSRLSPEEVAAVSGIIAYNAAYALTNHSIATKAKIDDPESAIAGLMLDGTGGGASIQKSQTLSSWSGSMTNLSSRMGFDLKTSFSDFKVSQADPWTLVVNYTYSYNLSDSATETRIVSPAANISVNVSIIGFPDPYLKREFGIERNILPAPRSMASESVSVIEENMRGRGWFYGGIFENDCLTKLEFEAIDEAVKFNESNKKMILCTTDRSVARDYNGLFGAVLFFSAIYNVGGDAFSDVAVPFAAKKDSPPDDLPSAVLIRSANDSTVTTNESNRIYDIENIRRFALCGYYYNSTAAVGGGYSFLGRLSDIQSTSPNNLETFVVGTWTPASKDTTKNYSSIDWAYVKSLKGIELIRGNKTMGMPGCKWQEMCNSTLADMRFRIDASHAAVYNMTEIICGDRCGSN